MTYMYHSQLLLLVRFHGYLINIAYEEEKRTMKGLNV